MQALYINLDERADRAEFLEAELSRVGLTAERLSAITPQTCPPELLERHCDRLGAGVAAAGPLVTARAGVPGFDRVDGLSTTQGQGSDAGSFKTPRASTAPNDSP